MTYGHILWSNDVVLICLNLISAPSDTNLNPAEFGWKSVDSVLVPNKCISLHYQRCTLLLVAARKNALDDVSAASLVLHAQYFSIAMKKNVVPKFTHKLSWKLHKICKYKVFLWAKFFNIWAESNDIYRKTQIRESLYICIFYPV